MAEKQKYVIVNVPREAARFDRLNQQIQKLVSEGYEITYATKSYIVLESK